MKALYINRDIDRVRDESTRNLLDQVGVPYERVPAITVSDMQPSDHALFTKIDYDASKHPGTSACSMSHIKAWKRVRAGADESTHWIVMEDDLLPAPGKLPLLRTLLRAWEDGGDAALRDRPYVFFLAAWRTQRLSLWRRLSIPVLRRRVFRQSQPYDVALPVRTAVLPGATWTDTGSSMYMLNAAAADLLIRRAEANGFHRALDWFILEQYRDLTFLCPYDRMLEDAAMATTVAAEASVNAGVSG